MNDGVEGLSKKYPYAFTGSPVNPELSGQLSIQCGSTTVGAGSNVWVAFPKAYINAPIGFASARNTVGAGGVVICGSEGTGSMLVTCVTASEPISWWAIGIGRI